MRIIIVAQQDKVRFAIRIALERLPGTQIIGEAMDLQELGAIVEWNKPDIVILDWELFDLPGEEPIRAMRDRCPNLSVIALDSRMEDRNKAMSEGADAFVCMCNGGGGLVSAVQAIGTLEAEVRKRAISETAPPR